MTVPKLQHTTAAYRTICGTNATNALPGQLDRAGLSRAVIFCGQSMVHRHCDVLGRLENELGTRLVGRFDLVKPQSPLPTVEAARDYLAEASADTVIAVGGGSAIVTARAASILLAEDKDIRELCTHRDDEGRMISPRLNAPKIPQWIVPTTPTTAYAKVGSAVRDPESGDRLALFDPKTRAQALFIDPEFALTSPAELVRGSALNALAMSIEGLQSDTDDPLADALLMHAMGLLARWIPQLAAAPDDPEPRVRLMLAALLSGQGSDFVGGGLAQALSHAVGPRSTTANGVVEALLLPHTMRYNASVCGPRQSAIADYLRRQIGQHVPESIGDISVIEEILAAAGVPVRLRDVGVTLDSLPEITAHALEDWAITRVPRPVNDGDIDLLLRAAW